MTSDPFKAAADLVQKLQGLKPISRPAWQRAVELNRELNRALEAMRLPDDFTVDDADSMPAPSRASAGVTSRGSVTVRAGLKDITPTEPTSAIEREGR